VLFLLLLLLMAMWSNASTRGQVLLLGDFDHIVFLAPLPSTPVFGGAVGVLVAVWLFFDAAAAAAAGLVVPLVAALGEILGSVSLTGLMLHHQDSFGSCPHCDRLFFLSKHLPAEAFPELVGRSSSWLASLPRHLPS
jgi:hypothetical protein